MTNDRVDVSRGVDERGAENNHAEAQVAAGDGLTQDNPSRPAEHQEKVRLGQEAMARQRRGWEDWLTIGEAFEVGRAEVMREIKTNETVGRRYEKAMQGWLIANGFTEIDKGTRSRLLECLKHRTEIERWRSVLTSSEQFRYNHPNTVLRKWKAATAVPDPNATPRISPFTKLKESIALLDEENHRLRREIERGGAGVAESSSEIANTAGTPGAPTPPAAKVRGSSPITMWPPPDMPWEKVRKFNTALIRLGERFGVPIDLVPHGDQRGQA